jgi:hypothetical protein
VRRDDERGRKEAEGGAGTPTRELVWPPPPDELDALEVLALGAGQPASAPDARSLPPTPAFAAPPRREDVHPTTLEPEAMAASAPAGDAPFAWPPGGRDMDVIDVFDLKEPPPPPPSAARPARGGRATLLAAGMAAVVLLGWLTHGLADRGGAEEGAPLVSAESPLPAPSATAAPEPAAERPLAAPSQAAGAPDTTAAPGVPPPPRARETAPATSSPDGGARAVGAASASTPERAPARGVTEEARSAGPPPAQDATDRNAPRRAERVDPAELLPRMQERASEPLPAALGPEVVVANEIPAPVPPAPSSSTPASTAAMASAAPPVADMPVATPSVPVNRTRLDEQRIHAVLGQYRSAYERLDAAAAKAVWPAVDQRALARAFDGLRAQGLEFDDCQVQVREQQATATCRGRATFVPRVGSGDTRIERRQWTFELQRSGESWVIRNARAR